LVREFAFWKPSSREKCLILYNAFFSMATFARDTFIYFLNRRRRILKVLKPGNSKANWGS
jgi:hypothetical protein